MSRASRTTDLTRRSFLKRAAAVALGAAGALEVAAQQAPPPLTREQRGDMWYRRLGRTELMVSEVSLGGSPPPEEGLFRECIERGVNYVDTSSGYGAGNSERTIGAAVKGRRDSFHITTKIHPRANSTKETLIAELEGSLGRLQTDYVDILLWHGIGSPAAHANEAVLEAFAQLKQDGKIRFTGVSCHRSQTTVLPPTIESGNYDIVNIAYNVYAGRREHQGKEYDDYLRDSGLEDVILLARQHDVGVIAMKPMAGGNFQKLDKYQGDGTPLGQAKIKWILSNPNVSAVITEMLSYDLMVEDLGAAGVPLTQAEHDALLRYAAATSRHVCRMCGACQRHCPQRIAIPDVLRYLSYYEGYGQRAEACQAYRSLPRAARPENCRDTTGQEASSCPTDCSACEAACPFGVHIRHKLARARRLLA